MKTQALGLHCRWDDPRKTTRHLEALERRYLILWGMQNMPKPMR